MRPKPRFGKLYTTGQSAPLRGYVASAAGSMRDCECPSETDARSIPTFGIASARRYVVPPVAPAPLVGPTPPVGPAPPPPKPPCGRRDEHAWNASRCAGVWLRRNPPEGGEPLGGPFGGAPPPPNAGRLTPCLLRHFANCEKAADPRNPPLRGASPFVEAPLTPLPPHAARVSAMSASSTAERMARTGRWRSCFTGPLEPPCLKGS